MDNFKAREDRFNFFESFEKPLLNICYELEVDDFRPFCKEAGHPVFHFFLYCLFEALDRVENFKYRIYQGEVIKIDEFIASYTVINDQNLFNYTRFKWARDPETFIKRSLEAKVEAMNSTKLFNTGIELTERELKNYVFITSLPWLKFTSIEHPIFKSKSADIPSVAWGRFEEKQKGKLVMPFAVQAHHGFVDGFHIYQLGEEMKKVIHAQIR